MEKILIIVRGIPGSGKSSFAQLLGRAICCADDYHTTRDGRYVWKAERVSAGHDWCQRKCRRFMKKQIERIVVANTSTTKREMQPYFDLARQFGYKVFSVVVENRHGQMNVHNVPAETLEKMKNRFEIQL
jgi:predicted kinase